MARTQKGEKAEHLYATALATLRVKGDECLVIEATSQGLAAAETQGLPTIVTLSKYADTGSLEGALAIVKSLPQLASPSLRDAFGPYGPEDRANLLASLLRLHAGLSLDPAFYEGIASCRLSEILVTKGSDVKSTTSSESIKALSQRLRQEGVGAMVVLTPQGDIAGIISERESRSWDCRLRLCHSRENGWGPDDKVRHYVRSSGQHRRRLEDDDAAPHSASPRDR